jgi:PleD family two-component response regulator
MAVLAAEAVRQLIESLVTDFMGTRITATLSLGVAQVGPAEAPAALYQRADELLYAAKRGGRNRVAV